MVLALAGAKLADSIISAPRERRQDSFKQIEWARIWISMFPDLSFGSGNAEALDVSDTN